MIKNFIIIILVLLLAFVLTIDKIAERAVEKAWEYWLGTKMDIGSVDVNLLEAAIDIRDVKFYNPEGFTFPLMADVPRIYINFSPVRLIKKEFYFEKFALYIKEFNTVRNERGKVNIDLLKPIKDKEEGIQFLEAEGTEVPNMMIGELHLKADRAFYRNYTKPPEQRVTVFEVNIDETYYRIKDPYTLVRLIIARVLDNTSMSGIVEMPMNEVNRIMKSGRSALGGAANAATGLFQNSVGKIKEVL